MPNHVHVCMEIIPGQLLPDLMASWKGYMSREINRHLGRNGTLWQKGYFDRLVRDWEHFGRVIRYFRRNPAGLPEGTFRLWESELAKRF